jgi:chlorobactene glucosyltransferase
MRNEEQHVDAILSSLVKLEYPKLEILVIDDDSTDRTSDMVQAWQAKDTRMHIHTIQELPTGWAGKTHALHQGVLHASGCF